MAVAAARLVLLGCTDEHRLSSVRRRLPVDETLGGGRRAAAAVADGLELVHELGMGEELGNRAERKPAKVLIESCGHDPGSALGEIERGGDDGRLEELHLVARAQGF